MLDDLRLYRRYVGISLRSQMEYRASFLMLAGSACFTAALDFMGVLVLFHRFGSLRGWTVAEVALLFGMISTAFAVAEAAARGFDLFPGMIRTGAFDRLLLRPRDTALQVAGTEFQLMRVGRLILGLGVLLWAAASLGVTWTVPKVLLLAAALGGGACLFVGLLVLQATMAFWTVETLELMNTVTHGGMETGQYPLEIYRPWFRRFFTVVVPLACVNYLPAQAVLGRSDPSGAPAWFQWASPAVGVLFLFLALQVWKVGVRHYCSTGS